MRFAHYFHLHQVPEWADAYIPYSKLKHLYDRALRERDSDQLVFDGLFSYLLHHRRDSHDTLGLYIAPEESIDSITEFYKQRQGVLSLLAAELGQ